MKIIASWVMGPYSLADVDMFQTFVLPPSSRDEQIRREKSIRDIGSHNYQLVNKDSALWS
jgi:hypothetical protein